MSSRWDLSENNRRARFYALTPEGRLHLRRDASRWMRFAQAVTLSCASATSCRAE